MFFANVVFLLAGFSHVESEVDNSVRVAPFVIVPRNELDEVGVKRNTSLSIEDRASRISGEVLADNFFISVTQDTLNTLA